MDAIRRAQRQILDSTKSSHPAQYPIHFGDRPKMGGWNDYSIGKPGIGAVNLAAYLTGMSEKEAAAGLARILGLAWWT
jgi:hypothetical protein